MRLTKEQIRLLRHRHRGYHIHFWLEVFILFLMTQVSRLPWIGPLLPIALALELSIFVARYSPFRYGKAHHYKLAALAIGIDLLWHSLLYLGFGWARLLSFPHVFCWLVFLSTSLIRQVRTLVREPYVNVSVLFGATSGYFMIGFMGGTLLLNLWVIDPSALAVNTLSSGLSYSAAFIQAPPIFVLSSFGMLTTIGTGDVQILNMLAQFAVNAIAAAGQLYIAVLIALILSRFPSRPI
jgi:hypothetical protein